MSWIEGIDAEFVFLNVSDEKTKNNKSLSKAQVKDCIFSLKQKLDHYPNAKIIALGKTAEQALLMLKVENFLSIPHPSGLNRSLNDPETLRLTKENIKHFSS
jgi:uracil-DNA glycosylase